MAVLALMIVLLPVTSQAGTWKKNSTGWWWQEDNGSWPANQWKYIHGTWYAFDGNGYMRTGWYWDGRFWYYLTGSGAMAEGWASVGGTWYYLQPGSGAMAEGWASVGGTWYYLQPGNGAMQTGWVKDGTTWYYMNSSGAMLTGWQLINGSWYYLYGNGKMAEDTWIGSCYVNPSGAWIPDAVQSQWIRSGDRWWYRHSDGSYTVNGWETINQKKYHFDKNGWMQTGWQKINGSWYYFDGAGWMATGWLKLGNNWYYLNPGNGAMVTGWLQLGSTWYYMNGSGAMETDTWIGNSYVDANGVWDQSKTKAQAYWVLNGDRWMLVQEDGTYAKKCWKTVGGKEYYLDENGYMVTGWLKQGSTWYYLKPTAKNSAEKVGEKAYNYWVGTAGIGGYYIDKYGRMIAGKDYSLGSYVYTFDANGLCTNRENRYLQVTDANGRKYNVEKKTYLSDPQVGVDVTEDEFLAAAVYAESANQGLTGMTGVAMVMLNRMRTNKTSLAPYPSEAKNMIYQATQFEVARDGALTRSLNLIVSGKGGTAMENAKKAVANARAICDAYDNNKTDELSDEVKGILEELKVPEGHTMLEYLGFMTPKAFENANLDPEKTYAFTYKNTTFYSTWIKKS